MVQIEGDIGRQTVILAIWVDDNREARISNTVDHHVHVVEDCKIHCMISETTSMSLTSKYPHLRVMVGETWALAAVGDGRVPAPGFCHQTWGGTGKNGEKTDELSAP